METAKHQLRRHLGLPAKRTGFRPDLALIGSSKIDNRHEDDDSYPDRGASEHSQKQIMNQARPIVPLIPNGAPGASP